MDRFSDRLKIWLAAREADRRAALCMIVFLLFSSGVVSGRGLLMVAGAALMIEGWAMLMTANTPVSPPDGTGGK